MGFFNWLGLSKKARNKRASNKYAKNLLHKHGKKTAENIVRNEEERKRDEAKTRKNAARKEEERERAEAKTKKSRNEINAYFAKLQAKKLLNANITARARKTENFLKNLKLPTNYEPLTRKTAKSLELNNNDEDSDDEPEPESEENKRNLRAMAANARALGFKTLTDYKIANAVNVKSSTNYYDLVRQAKRGKNTATAKLNSAAAKLGVSWEA